MFGEEIAMYGRSDSTGTCNSAGSTCISVFQIVMCLVKGR